MMVKKTLFYLCVSLVLSIGNADNPLFRYDYKYYPEAQGWLKLHQIPATWSDARLMCKQEGAVLASPENDNMLGTIRFSASGIAGPYKRTLYGLPVDKKIFIGVHATYAKGHYYSIEGTPLTRMTLQWATGEPNNKDNEECLAMLLDGKISDVNCTDRLPFVCYKRRTADMIVTQCGTVDKDYGFDARTNSCYKFHTDSQDWSSAFATCSDEGGYLAIINSNTESQVLKELYEKVNASLTEHISGNVLLGFTDWKDHRMWMTIHGQTLKEAGFDKWDDDQPDNDSSHCGGMFEYGLLDDLPCNEPHIFICEMDPPVPNDTETTTVDDDYHY